MRKEPPIILGPAIKGTRLITRFQRVLRGGHVWLPPVFIPPRPCTTDEAARIAVAEAARHGYSEVVVGAAAGATPVAARKGTA
jgi:hypothetical protein